MSEVHAQARTTPLIRAEIKASNASVQELALRYNVTAPTIRKWRARSDVQDLSHRPHRLCTTLSPGEEAVVIELRKTLMLPLDDLLAVTREFVNEQASRPALARCLTRHGLGNLRQMQAEQNPGETPVVMTFKSYEPGFVHVDIKYLPQMPDETARRYLFVAIDCATRWVHVGIYADQSELSSTHCKRSVNPSFIEAVKLGTLHLGNQRDEVWNGSTADGELPGAGDCISGIRAEGEGMGRGERRADALAGELVRAFAPLASAA